MQQIMRALRIRTGSAPLEAQSEALTLPSAAFLVGTLWLAYVWPWLSGQIVIPWDAKNHFYAMLRFLAASLHSGDSPAWAPFHFAGFPLIADPQSLIFSPFMRLLAMLTPEPALWQADLAEFLALLVGGIGLLLLFRERGWNLWGGALAAVVFMAGGPASARLQHAGQIFSYALIPLAFWALTRLALRRNLSSGLLFGAIAGVLAVGRDQVAYLGCLLVAGYALALLLGAENRKAFARSVAAPAAVASLAALAIVAVPVLMTMSLAAISNRPDVAFDIAGRGSLPPVSLLTLPVANLFGSLGAEEALYWGPGSGVWNDKRVWAERSITYLYVGAVPVALILGEGLLRRRFLAPEIRFFGLAALAALIYALGWYTPVFRVAFDHVPGVDLFRRPADATFHFNLALAILAGYALHRLLTDSDADRRTTWPYVLGALIVVCVLGLALASTLGQVGACAKSVAAAVVLAGLAVLAIEVARHVKGAGVAGLLLVTFASLDLSLYNAASSLNSEPVKIYRALAGSGDRVASFVKGLLARETAPDRRDRIEVLGLSGAWQNAPMAQGLEATLGYNPLQIAEYSRTTGAGQNAHRTVDRVFTPLFPSYKSPLADLMGLRYIVLGAPIEEVDRRIEPGEMPLVARLGNTWIYENRTALPR
ncbi:MAG: hypothetical protein M3145_09215, partial [Pseudomonadota bacterium]|nr:hypothetical protein [Pseudomonadota bacterium]